MGCLTKRQGKGATRFISYLYRGMFTVKLQIPGWNPSDTLQAKATLTYCSLRVVPDA